MMRRGGNKETNDEENETRVKGEKDKRVKNEGGEKRMKGNQ